jgi:hypothetical protein
MESSQVVAGRRRPPIFGAIMPLRWASGLTTARFETPDLHHRAPRGGAPAAGSRLHHRPDHHARAHLVAQTCPSRDAAPRHRAPTGGPLARCPSAEGITTVPPAAGSAAAVAAPSPRARLVAQACLSRSRRRRPPCSRGCSLARCPSAARITTARAGCLRAHLGAQACLFDAPPRRRALAGARSFPLGCTRHHPPPATISPAAAAARFARAHLGRKTGPC